MKIGGTANMVAKPAYSLPIMCSSMIRSAFVSRSLYRGYGAKPTHEAMRISKHHNVYSYSKQNKNEMDLANSALSSALRTNSDIEGQSIIVDDMIFMPFAIDINIRSSERKKLPHAFYRQTTHPIFAMTTKQYSRVACVTGANKGIGLAIVRRLALQYPKSQLNDGPLLLYLCSRNEQRGRQALMKIDEDEDLLRAKVLRRDGGPVDITYHALDVSDEKSIEAFRDHLKREHPEGIDVIINNAAIALDGFDSQVVEDTMQTNYYGTMFANRAFLPLLRKGGCMVNVSSSAGKLSRFTPQLAERFRNAKSIGDVTSILQDFQKAVDAGREQQEGFKSAAYATSKVALNAATRILAAENTDILLNCCNPGYVNTDMSKGRGVKTPDEGAETPVYLAIGDIGGRTGLYWSDMRPEDY